MKTVCCYGDSNTWGYDPRSFPGDSYPRPWCRLLGENCGCRTVNGGENGRCIPADPWSLDMVERWLEKEEPELLLILLGTNDILMGAGTPEQLARRMEQLLERLERKFPQMRILLLSPPRLAVQGMSAQPLARCLERMARQRDTAFLDVSGWQIPLTFDGVHFSEEGHERFADCLTGVVREML